MRFCGDVTDSASMDVLPTNLIMGTRLPSALLWIIHPECGNGDMRIEGYPERGVFLIRGSVIRVEPGTTSCTQSFLDVQHF